MFEPEECIGIEATDYLIEQGFTAFAESVYEGPDDIITDGEINFDDTHPRHNEFMQQFVEHSVTVIIFTGDEASISFGWSSGEIRSISENFPKDILEHLNKLIHAFNLQFESVDESE
jgi:hypothetical protein